MPAPPAQDHPFATPEIPTRNNLNTITIDRQALNNAVGTNCGPHCQHRPDRRQQCHCAYRVQFQKAMLLVFRIGDIHRLKLWQSGVVRAASAGQ
ncbi:hypothetical protein [Ensifer canadensis]